MFSWQMLPFVCPSGETIIECETQPCIEQEPFFTIRNKQYYGFKWAALQIWDSIFGSSCWCSTQKKRQKRPRSIPVRSGARWPRARRWGTDGEEQPNHKLWNTRVDDHVIHCMFAFHCIVNKVNIWEAKIFILFILVSVNLESQNQWLLLNHFSKPIFIEQLLSDLVLLCRTLVPLISSVLIYIFKCYISYYSICFALTLCRAHCHFFFKGAI